MCRMHCCWCNSEKSVLDNVLSERFCLSEEQTRNILQHLIQNGYACSGSGVGLCVINRKAVVDKEHLFQLYNLRCLLQWDKIQHYQ